MKGFVVLTCQTSTCIKEGWGEERIAGVRGGGGVRKERTVSGRGSERMGGEEVLGRGGGEREERKEETTKKNNILVL